MSGFSAAPSLQRGNGSTPPPTRPRLFARTGADRKSPPPPARLTPITPVATPVLSPEPAAQLWRADEPQHAHLHLSHRREDDDNTAKRLPQQQHPQEQQQQKVMLTPPRGGSGGAAPDADWSGHGRIESMLTTKRERFISSADTQHSMASSSTPPPRCKRAVNNTDNNRTPTRTSSHHHHHRHHHTASPQQDGVVATPSDTVEGSDAGVKLSPTRQDRLRLSHSTSRSSSSRGAISDDGYSFSSDLVAAAAAVARKAATAPSLCATASVSGATETAGEPASASHTTTATAQCLVLDDSVDSTAIVPAEQLQRMLEQAALGRGGDSAYPAEPPTPYRRRLITAEVLRDWTGWEDLELVLATQLRLDAEAMLGVEQMAQHLPRLSSLKLSGSRIPRLRQLGTGFHALKFLWLNSCHLTDLRGLAACCPALVELYVSFNYIADVTPVMELSSTLEVLDVEGNLLDDASSLGFVLSSLLKVTALSLQGNPLTCEHQGRVREAYAAAIDEADVQRDEETTTVGAAGGGGVAALAAPTRLDANARFSDILRAWVRDLMPQLQTLNDEPMELADEGDAETPAASATPTTTATSKALTTAQRRAANTNTTAAVKPRVSSARAAHVDPLDDRLAEELRLVAACVREMDPFDPLLEAVDAANQRVYSRPSTSCNGARPRLTPATAMGAATSRPSTSARSACSSSAATTAAGGGPTSAATDASTLTTGAVLAGSATASLRRRLATPTPTPLTASLEGPAARATSTRLGDYARRSGGDNGGAGATAETDAEEDARVAALLADDSEEEEWEHFKSSLLLSSSSATATTDGADAATGAPGTHRPSLISLSSAAAATTSLANVGLTMEEDGFDKELKSELTRLRLRMAKAGRAV